MLFWRVKAKFTGFPSFSAPVVRLPSWSEIGEIAYNPRQGLSCPILAAPKDDAMANTLSSIATIFRSMISLILLALLGTGSWMAYQTYHERERLGRELQEAKAEVER